MILAERGPPSASVAKVAMSHGINTEQSGEPNTPAGVPIPVKRRIWPEFAIRSPLDPARGAAHRACCASGNLDRLHRCSARLTCNSRAIPANLAVLIGLHRLSVALRRNHGQHGCWRVIHLARAIPRIVKAEKRDDLRRPQALTPSSTMTQSCPAAAARRPGPAVRRVAASGCA